MKTKMDVPIFFLINPAKVSSIREKKNVLLS